MTAVDFGAAFAKKNSPDMAGLLESLAAAIKAAVIADLTEARKPPPITIQPAQVTVAAPNVTVTPTINVDTEPPDVNVTVDLAALAAKMDIIHTDLVDLARILMLPVTKTVDRKAGLIQKVTETR